MENDETVPAFDALGMIRKAQIDTVLDAIQMIVRLAADSDERDKKDADHIVHRLQNMLRTF